MKIAFFTNHDKTEFFHALTPHLEKQGHELFWISTSRIWSNWLTARGVNESHLLDITRFGPEWSKKQALSGIEETFLHRMEKVGGLTINNIILMDRMISRKPFPYARACLAVAGREIMRFLCEHQVTALFSEATWALEIMAIIICRELDIDNFSPNTVRIPANRFGFFTGYNQAEMISIREPNDTDRTEAEQFYDYFLQKGPRPAYFNTDIQTPRPHLNWASKLVAGLKRKSSDPYDVMRFSLKYLVRKRWGEVYNSRRVIGAGLFEKVALPPRRPFVLNTLHAQPEASIDVMGAFCSNQTELIKVLARSLPVTHDLYVKEHHISLGSRPLEFYRAIKQIPGVRLIDPYADSHQLIHHADLVIALSGTIAYEAALYGKPAMTVVPMFFGPILIANGFDPFRNSFEKINNILRASAEPAKPKATLKTNLDFLARIIASSFEGIISDPRHDPGCMRPENIENVARATNMILELAASKELAVRS